MKLNEIKDQSLRDHVMMRLRECYQNDMRKYLDGCHQLNADFGDTFPQFEDYCDRCNHLIPQIIGVRQWTLDKITEEQKEEIKDFVLLLEQRLIDFWHEMDDNDYPTEAFDYLKELIEKLPE